MSAKSVARRFPQMETRTFAVTNARIVGIALIKSALFVQTVGVNLCVGRVARSHLLPATPPVFDSIGEKAFLADRAHVDQGTMHAGRQKFLAQTC